MAPHTTHSAIITMHEHEGAPWGYPRWQEITGIEHGLAPEDDAHLPPGWTRKDAENVAHFFDLFFHKKTNEARIKFARQRKDAHKVPGRAFFQRYLTALFKDADIHSRIRDKLVELELHPVTIALSSTEGSIRKWLPSPALYTMSAVDQVALELFGPESLDRLGRLSHQLRQPLASMINITWLNIRKQVVRLLDKIESFEQEAVQAFNALGGKARPTQKDLRTVITKVSRWKTAAEKLQDGSHLKKVEKMEEDLESLMAGFGLKVTKEVKNKDLEKLAQKMRTSLASPDEVADVIALYKDLFSGEEPVDYENLGDQLTLDLNYTGDEVDPGIVGERSMTPDQLSLSLGFLNRRPVLFNTHRHFSGSLNGWKPSDSNPPERYFKRELGDADKEMVALNLHCHQLAGVHATARQVFSEKPHDGRLGSGIFDEVGLGKSFQALALVGFLMDNVRRQKEGSENVPPLLRQRPYLGNSTEIPNHATLIVAPGTLLTQWHNECQVAFRPKSVDITVYPSSRREQMAFWEPNGPYHSSNHDPSNRVIIASHAALAKEYGLVHTYKISPTDAVPWLKRSPLPGIEKTLFGQKFLAVILDEAHEFRNVGPKHSAALAILDEARIRIAMTATPLQTSTKDLAAMGRLIGIDYFLTEAAHVEEKQQQANLRRLRRENLNEAKAEDVSLTDDDPYRNKQRDIAEAIRKQFGDRLLRRTLKSKDYEGQALIKLPPLVEHTFVLALQPWELSIIDALTSKVAADLNDLTFSRIVSTRFYIEYRMGVGYARTDLKDPIPTFDTLDDWNARKSSKFDACARICAHLLSSDRAGTPYVKDGELVFPPTPALGQGEVEKRTNKVLIYQEFPSLGPLLRNVMNLYGILYFWIDGDTGYDERALRVKKFYESTTQRVLIFSQVGSVGLNMPCANYLIFLDQPWSAQDERQIRGRLYRQPQARVVTCFHLLAEDTADVLLSVLARNKQHMLEAFLSRSKDSIKAVHGHLVGKMHGTDEESEDDNPPSENEYEETKKKKRSNPKPSKSQSKADAKAADSSMPEAPPSAKINAKGSRTKKAVNSAVVTKANADSSINASSSSASKAQPSAAAVTTARGGTEQTAAPGKPSKAKGAVKKTSIDIAKAKVEKGRIADLAKRAEAREKEKLKRESLKRAQKSEKEVRWRKGADRGDSDDSEEDGSDEDDSDEDDSDEDNEKGKRKELSEQEKAEAELRKAARYKAFEEEVAAEVKELEEEVEEAESMAATRRSIAEQAMIPQDLTFMQVDRGEPQTDHLEEFSSDPMDADPPMNMDDDGSPAPPPSTPPAGGYRRDRSLYQPPELDSPERDKSKKRPRRMAPPSSPTDGTNFASEHDVGTLVDEELGTLVDEELGLYLYIPDFSEPSQSSSVQRSVPSQPSQVKATSPVSTVHSASGPTMKAPSVRRNPFAPANPTGPSGTSRAASRGAAGPSPGVLSTPSTSIGNQRSQTDPQGRRQIGINLDPSNPKAQTAAGKMYMERKAKWDSTQGERSTMERNVTTPTATSSADPFPLPSTLPTSRNPFTRKTGNK